MTERDVFEVRFGVAVRGYAGRVSSDLDPVAIAHRIAVAEPRRHGLAAALAWRGVAIPRVAWLLLLGALVAAAVIGGTLLVGSQMQRRLSVIVPPVGQEFECPPGSTPDEPGPVDQARPPLSPWASAFDRRAGRIVLVASISSDDGPGIATWTFDVCTNTWTRMHPNREPPSPEWTRLVYDVDSDVTMLVSSGGVWAYDLQTNTWTEKGVVTDAWLWAYDPLSGRVVAQGGLDPSVPLSTYDVETDTWTPIHEVGAPEIGAVSGGGWPVYGALAYDASVDRVVAYNGYNAGHETWLLDIRTGRWSKSDAVTPHVLDWLTFPAIAYDEAAKRTVVGGNVRLAAYDATADRWETVEFPRVYHGVALVYDPVNERLVLFPDSWEQWTDGTDTGVVAFDLVTHEWTVLLEPSDGQPAPSSE